MTGAERRSIAKWEASSDIVGVWAPGWTHDKVSSENGRFPLNLNIVNYPQG